jgi:hypothetical protein
MHVMGCASPAEFFRKLRDFTLRNITPAYTGDVLLTGSTKDHFVPIEHFFLAAESFAGASSLTTRLFTEADSAEDHCQFGNVKLTLDTMIDWIEQMDNRRYDD